MDPFPSIKNVDDFYQFSNTMHNGCTRCSLSKHKGNHPVIFRGNPQAPIALFGEAPGLHEQLQRKPFVGPAGQLLDKILIRIVELDPEVDVFFSNIVFCRPIAEPGESKQNSAPKKEYIKQCFPLVKKLISIIDPPIIICCGLYAAKTILSLPDNILLKDIEGKWFTLESQRNIFVMRHPSNILRLAPFPEEERKIKLLVQNYMRYFKSTKDQKIAYYKEKTYV